VLTHEFPLVPLSPCTSRRTGERAYIRNVELVYAEANQFILFGVGTESSGPENEVSNAGLAAHLSARLGTLVVFMES
jgi:hypothetical protein